MKWIMFFVALVVIGSAMSSGDPLEEAALSAANSTTTKTSTSTAQASAKTPAAQDYRVACRLRLRQEAKFRSKVNITTAEALQAPKDPRIWFVKGTADMMTGLGAMVPHTFMCKFEDGKMVNFAAAPGD